MGKIFMIRGKSASGKDTISSLVLKALPNQLEQIVPYTTRPMRPDEVEGEQYHFITEKEMNEIPEEMVIERRCYQTVYGDWYYMNLKKDIDLDSKSYIVIGTITVLEAFREIYKEKVVAIYIYSSAKERLLRSINRSKGSTKEMMEICRRFLKDEEDFNIEHITYEQVNLLVSNTGDPAKASQIITNFILKAIVDNTVDNLKG